MRKGSTRAQDWPRLRRSLTPAPSDVGTDSMTRCKVRTFMKPPRVHVYAVAARRVQLRFGAGAESRMHPVCRPFRIRAGEGESSRSTAKDARGEIPEFKATTRHRGRRSAHARA